MISSKSSIKGEESVGWTAMRPEGYLERDERDRIAGLDPEKESVLCIQRDEREHPSIGQSYRIGVSQVAQALRRHGGGSEGDTDGDLDSLTKLRRGRENR
jgi:hypothetical protein